MPQGEMSMTDKERETEQQLADYYQAHKDDPDEWSDPVPAPRGPGRPSRGLLSRITVRFTREETQLLDRISEANGWTYAEAIRQAVLAYANQTSAGAKSA